MSDLFRSALGYLSSGTSATSNSSQGQGGGAPSLGGYNSASGGPSDETNAVGEIITFTSPPGRPSSVSRNVRITKLIAEGNKSFISQLFMLVTKFDLTLYRRILVRV